MARGFAKLIVHVWRGRNPLYLAHAGIEPPPCDIMFVTMSRVKKIFVPVSKLQWWE